VSVFIVLLRAVNVGGTGKLPMADLKALCIEAGFKKVHTYIASGNVVLESSLTEAQIRLAIESSLKAYAGKEVGVVVRSVAEMKDVLKANPYPDKAANRTVAIFLNEPPPPSALDNVKGRLDEEMAIGKREIFVHYGAGMGSSKLIIPAAKAGTARNMNTVSKLIELGENVAST
jgi:uncharacterized protein (DUF1697 family)